MRMVTVALVIRIVRNKKEKKKADVGIIECRSNRKVIYSATSSLLSIK